MKPYYVITPVYGTVVPILGDGSGPTEYGRDVVHVYAANQRSAIALGTKQMLREYPNGWAAQNRRDGRPPFRGITAVLDACHHGSFINDDDPAVACPACHYELAAQERAGVHDW